MIWQGSAVCHTGWRAISTWANIVGDHSCCWYVSSWQACCKTDTKTPLSLLSHYPGGNRLHWRRLSAGVHLNVARRRNDQWVVGAPLRLRNNEFRVFAGLSLRRCAIPPPGGAVLATLLIRAGIWRQAGRTGDVSSTPTPPRRIETRIGATDFPSSQT